MPNVRNAPKVATQIRAKAGVTTALTVGTLELMRLLLLAAIVVSALASVGGARPGSTEAIASYCLQPTGEQYRDICYAVNGKRTTGTHQLILGMQERYFLHYGLCVRAPRAKRMCRAFPVPPAPPGTYSPRYGGVVSWERNFAHRARGAYWVTWWAGGHRLGPALRVTLPAT
jgi:hypothetical protein